MAMAIAMAKRAEDFFIELFTPSKKLQLVGGETPLILTKKKAVSRVAAKL